MESIDKLRDYSHLDDDKWTLETGEIIHMYGSKPNDPNAVNWGEQWRKIADEIEQEIAERFVELPEGWTAEQACEVLGYWPRWDDGSPCMFGDEFTCWPTYYHKEKYEALSRLAIYAPDHVWNKGKDDEEPHHGGYYEWNFMRPGGDDCESYRPTKRKPRTLESILCDALADVSCMGDGIVRHFEPDEPYVVELSAEIRELLGVS